MLCTPYQKVGWGVNDTMSKRGQEEVGRAHHGLSVLRPAMLLGFHSYVAKTVKLRRESVVGRAYVFTGTDMC